MAKPLVLLSLVYFCQGVSETNAGAPTKKPTPANLNLLPTHQNHPLLNKPSNPHANPPTGIINKINTTPHTPPPPITKPPIPANPPPIYPPPSGNEISRNQNVPRPSTPNASPQNPHNSSQKSVQASPGHFQPPINLPPKQPQSNNVMSDARNASPKKAQTNAGSKSLVEPKNVSSKSAVANAVPRSMNGVKSSPPKNPQTGTSPQNPKKAPVNSKKPNSNLKRSVNPKALPPKIIKSSNSGPQNLVRPASNSAPINSTPKAGKPNNAKPQNPTNPNNSPPKTGFTSNSSNKNPSNPNVPPPNSERISNISPQNSALVKSMPPNNAQTNARSPQNNHNLNGMSMPNADAQKNTASKSGPPNSGSPQNSIGKVGQTGGGHPQNTVTSKNADPKSEPAGRGNLQNPINPKIGQTNAGGPQNSAPKNGPSAHQNSGPKNAAPVNRVKKSNLSAPKKSQGCRYQKRGVGQKVPRPQIRGQRAVTKPPSPVGGRVKKNVMTYPEFHLYSMNHPYDDPSIWSIVPSNRKRRSVGDRPEMDESLIPKIRVKKDAMAAPGHVFHRLENSIIEDHPFNDPSDWSSMSNYRKRRYIRHKPEMKVNSPSRRSVGKNSVVVPEKLRHLQKTVIPSLPTLRRNRKLQMTQNKPEIESNFLTNNRIRRSIRDRPETNKLSSPSRRSVEKSSIAAPQNLRHRRKSSITDFPSLSIRHQNRKLLRAHEEKPEIESSFLTNNRIRRSIRDRPEMKLSSPSRRSVEKSSVATPQKMRHRRKSSIADFLSLSMRHQNRKLLRAHEEEPEIETSFLPRRAKKSIVASPENLLYSLKNSIIDASTLTTLQKKRIPEEARNRKQRSIKPETKKKLQLKSAQRVKSNAIPEDLFYSVKKPIVDAPYVKSAMLKNRKPREMLADRPEMRFENPALSYFREVRRNSPLDNLNDKFWVKKI